MAASAVVVWRGASGDAIKDREEPLGPRRQGRSSRLEIEERKDLMATTPASLPEPLLVANLPLPPDIAEEVAGICRQRRYTRHERAAVEEDLKLRHHYAGHFVIATAGPHGLQIHAIDLEDPDEVHELKKRLGAQGHRHILSLYPTSWKDPDVTIVTLNPQS
jgi:hypothetical protein